MVGEWLHALRLPVALVSHSRYTHISFIIHNETRSQEKKQPESKPGGANSCLNISNGGVTERPNVPVLKIEGACRM